MMGKTNGKKRESIRLKTMPYKHLGSVILFPGFWYGSCGCIVKHDFTIRDKGVAMQRFLSIGLATLAMVAVAVVSPVYANLIVNGSFETGPAPGSFTTLFNGSTVINGWTVGGDSIDYIGTYWNAQDGSRSIDLAGNGPGSISQTFGTTSGQTYHVEFWMAGNPDGGDTLKAIAASGGSVSGQIFTFSTIGHSRGDMGWENKFFDFIATGSTTTLTFASDITGPYGPAIDNVSVPEPATLILLGSGLMALAIASGKRSRRG
jgi:choice-of-anchor C domain-containing protein